MNNVINFLKTRRSTSAKTMFSGHINESDLNDILACGIRVPDHGALNPWSLTVIKDDARSRIGKEILVPEYIQNNPVSQFFLTDQLQDVLFYLYTLPWKYFLFYTNLRNL